MLLRSGRTFSGNYYELSVEFWHSSLRDLKVSVDEVHYHPERCDHPELWSRRGYCVVPDTHCLWSDGTIGGNCCELDRGVFSITEVVRSITAKMVRRHPHVFGSVKVNCQQRS